MNKTIFCAKATINLCNINEEPKGSPLSVVLFLIAYNKLRKIISIHREINYVTSAGDINLLLKSGKCINP